MSILDIPEHSFF